MFRGIEYDILPAPNYEKYETFYENDVELQQRNEAKRQHRLQQAIKFARGLLRLDALYLNEIPQKVYDKNSLKVLLLFNNQIQQIPECIDKLHNLRVLHLANNQLNYLPAEIGKLIHLKELWLENNFLNQIPVEIGCCINLKFLSLDGNPLNGIFFENNKWIQIWNFLNFQNNNNQLENNFKQENQINSDFENENSKNSQNNCTYQEIFDENLNSFQSNKNQAEIDAGCQIGNNKNNNQVQIDMGCQMEYNQKINNINNQENNSRLSNERYSENNLNLNNFNDDENLNNENQQNLNNFENQPNNGNLREKFFTGKNDSDFQNSEQFRKNLENSISLQCLAENQNRNYENLDYSNFQSFTSNIQNFFEEFSDLNLDQNQNQNFNETSENLDICQEQQQQILQNQQLQQNFPPEQIQQQQQNQQIPLGGLDEQRYLYNQILQFQNINNFEDQIDQNEQQQKELYWFQIRQKTQYILNICRKILSPEGQEQFQNNLNNFTKKLANQQLKIALRQINFSQLQNQIQFAKIANLEESKIHFAEEILEILKQLNFCVQSKNAQQIIQILNLWSEKTGIKLNQQQIIGIDYFRAMDVINEEKRINLKLKVQLQQKQQQKIKNQSLYDPIGSSRCWSPKCKQLTYDQWLANKAQKKKQEEQEKIQKQKQRIIQQKRVKKQKEIENLEREKNWPVKIMEPHPPGTFKPSKLHVEHIREKYVKK